MRRLSLAVALSAGVLAFAPVASARDTAPAPAPTSAPAPVPAKPAKDDPNRMVCTREHEVGSNRPKKVCMTVAQRQALKDAADRALDPGRRRTGDSAIPGAAAQ
jgi:hypothetical protein